MELSDFLRGARRRLWILILAPLLAAGAVVAIVFNGPIQYQASATVTGTIFVRSSGATYSGGNAAESFVGDFISTVRSPAVVTAVAQATHVDEQRIRQGLSASQVGDGAVLKVTFRTSRKEEAEAVAKAAATSATETFIRAPVDLARYPMEQAQQEADAAQAALDRFAQESGSVLPDRDYQNRAQQINNLKSQEVSAASKGDTAAAGSISATLAAEEKALAALEPKVAEYTRLVAERDRALRRLDDTRQALQAREAVQRVADPATIVSVAPTRAASRREVVARRGTIAAGGALFLAIGLVVLLEVLDRRRPGVDMAEPSATLPAL